MNNDTPLVSVCIPVFNGERYIHETLTCVLNQTYKNIEVIISDNCSTDSTLQIVRDFADPRIKIFSNERNMGVKYNYIKAFSYGQGKYLSFLSADDGMDLTTIEKGVAIMESEKYKSVGLVSSYIKIIDDNGKHLYTKKFLFGGGLFSSRWAIRSNFLYGSNIIGEPNGALFKRESYARIPEPKFGNGNTWTFDVDMQNELLLLGDLYILPEVLGKFRLSSQSTSFKDLRFNQARLFRQYAFTIYRDKRYNLSFFWVITATVNSWILQVLRNLFYLLFVRKRP
jgi:glycosyltransferase involved in cell wall biosynthesis